MSLEEKARALAQQQQAAKAVDWPARRDWWLAQLNDLYVQAEGWLAGLVAENVVSCSRTPVRLSESQIGAYAADALIIDFTGTAVVLEPKGTVIVAARGRVDVFRRGRRGAEPAMLILVGEKDSPEWEIWPSRDPQRREKLSEKTFKSLLEALI